MRKFILLVVLAGAGLTARSQRISYIVSFPNLVHHEARIEVIVSDIPSRNAVFRMSRSSPGRYATHEFGKNVYDVTATDAQGKPLTVNRTDGDVYEVPRHNGYVRLTYTLYGDYADGTYVGIDPAGIHLNMPGAFMWMKGVDNVPISIHFAVPEALHWTIATQLEPTSDPLTFTARGLQYFMDCPTVIGDLHYKSWTVKNPDGKSYTFRIALDGKDDEGAFSSFADKVRKVVLQEQAVYGEVPAYDYGTYTFLASVNPYVHGDGMEHRNSTMITIPVVFADNDRLLGVFAHEFFHCWNVKRIRPRTLEPFNFEKSDMSHELWFAEGFTQYYGDLLVLRSGIGTDSEYVQNTLSGLINTKMNTPGALFYSPVEDSRMAVFVDAGVSVDRTNYPNMYTSYYPYGGAIALALDLELREHYKKTLDDLMQAAWKRFGKPEIPYTVPGLEDVLASVTSDRKFASAWFAKYVYGHEPIDYNSLLAPAGYTLKKAAEGKAWIGNVRWLEKDGLNIASNTVRGTPLYEAGLDVDDRIISLDNQSVATQADLTRVLGAHHPGDRLPISYRHHDQDKTATIQVQESPSVSALTFEKAGLSVTPDIQAFRRNWLGAKGL
ncbi:MAG: PDZ domain-containing protein [Bacteroidota bacterium]|nr:PDZ domain-containing protein [Bacteroidota bacterium]